MSSIQLIDEEKRFSKDVADFCRKSSNETGQSKYHVVAVFGSQSSGKSTLLNTLFHTSFDTMDAGNRRQTTKGIWMAKGSIEGTVGKSQYPNLFVLDVEGSDGSERGEDQDFERKAALFAISVSEVLIINMWEQQIGLYQGNNMALLKTVFEVNLSLFGKHRNDNNHKVLLLFVIRDHVGVTPLMSLQQTLVTELEKIWEQLVKPSGCQDTTLYDFFDLEFVGLAHKLLQEEKFINDVRDLGRLFAEDNANTYFKPNYHHNLPLDGWVMYADNCWEQIEHNKDLDLPTQQILVARFKTDEIANEAMTTLMKDYDSEIESVDNDIDSLTRFLSTLKGLCLQTYDERASKYAQSVYLAKRSDLLDQINSHFYSAIENYISRWESKGWDSLINDVTSKEYNHIPFHERLLSFSNTFKTKFLRIIEQFVKLELLRRKDELISSFEILLEEKLQKLREDELRSLKIKWERTVAKEIKDKTIHLLSQPTPNVWDEILNSLDEIMQRALNKYKMDDGKFDFHIGYDEVKNEKIEQELTSIVWETLNKSVHDYLKEETILNILRDRFENKFRYDENDVPRLWKNEAEIEQSYKISKEYALQVFDVLTLAKTSNNVEVVPKITSNVEDDDTIYEDELGIYHARSFAHILNEVQKEKVLKQFRRQINLAVLDAKRSIITTTTHIPIWIYALLVALGWNEFMLVIRNPLFMTLALILIVFLYFVHRFDLWGPVISVVNTAVGETRNTMKNKLRSFVLEEHEVSPALNDKNNKEPEAE